MNRRYKLLILTALLFNLLGCQDSTLDVDVLIVNGSVFDGTGSSAQSVDLAFVADTIVFIGDAEKKRINAKRTIDATGLIVTPGFIDPHTHSLGDLRSATRNHNINYLTQGVTTVFNGNDGEGPFRLNALAEELEQNGIGTNTAFFVGHNTVRQEVLGNEDVQPTGDQLEEMKALVKQGMEEGALGISTGLYYAPGSFSETPEVIELTKVVKPYNGVYDTHLRDESTYNIGLINAVKETIEIGKESGVSLHFGHIKALGVDVWGKSVEMIGLIQEAQEQGQKITADQYPWRASGTHIGNALLNRWVMAGSNRLFLSRLTNPNLLPRIKSEMKENLRRRGGPEAILITADVSDTTLIGLNLQQVADKMKLSPVDAALKVIRDGGTRVASFNMNPKDMKNFMTLPWVMTSSDGTRGHPRKYASFPKKYDQYVVKDKWISLEQFIHRSSGLVAETFRIDRRGVLAVGNFADVLVFDPETFKASADFSNPELLTKGVEYLWVNGQLSVESSEPTNSLAGRVLRKKVD